MSVNKILDVITDAIHDVKPALAKILTEAIVDEIVQLTLSLKNQGSEVSEITAKVLEQLKKD